MKLRKNVPVSKDEKTRKVWPFINMAVNDCLDFDDRYEHREAAVRAYDFGAKQKPKWKFQAQWLKKTGVGRIRRVL